MPIKAIIIVGHGKDCPYCGRVMSILGKSDTDAYPTRDHIKSRLHGGGPRVIVCRKCNLDKQSMSLSDWQRKLAGADDARAPVVAAFIELMATGGHLKIIKKYERLAMNLSHKEKSNVRKRLERERGDSAPDAGLSGSDGKGDSG